MSATEARNVDADVQRAIEKMRSLRDGDIGVVDAVSCGRRAVPALRELLFERETSGLYQPRRWAAQALSILGAYEVLFDLLSTTRDARDPVERAGDDAVINAAAGYLSALREERVFRLLLRLAKERLRPGIIGALATFHRREALPYFVDALAEDDCRLMAEPALAAFGEFAQGPLVAAIAMPQPSAESESETSIRKRRSALGLLMEIGAGRQLWPFLQHLVADKDPGIAVLACDLCLSAAPETEWSDAVHRLIVLLENPDWRLGREIEECLVRHYGKTGRIIGAEIHERVGREVPEHPGQDLLLRVQSRGNRNEARLRKGARD